MISVNNLFKSFGEQNLFDDLTFNVGRRERIGLVGRNGHGKSTLFRIILGQEAAESGEIVIPKRYRLGYLEQHIAFTKENVLEEACLGLPQDQRDEYWQAEKILFGLGFAEEDMSRSPLVFSGGYQVRLNLAKVLLSQPDLLMLDEPTNYLDVVSIRWLARFLAGWRGELMLITHDRGFMDSVTTHTVAIHRRKARKIEGTTSKLYEQILQDEEIYEKTRANEEKKRKQTERFIERFRAKNTLATRVQSRIKSLEKQEQKAKLENIETLDFQFNSSAFNARQMMTATNITFGYDETPLIADFSLDIYRNDRICIIGQNGRGKSTLLSLLAQELTPDAGEVSCHPKLQTGYFAQTNTDTLHPGNDVVQEIMSASSDCLPQTARDVAGRLMFEGDNALKKISVLSGGEKSRVMLGKLLVSPTHLLFLDEPTNHLDMDSCDSLLAAIDAFPGAVVIVTHNETFLHTVATRFVIFDRGRVFHYDRTYQEFLDEIGWEVDDSLKTKKPAPTQHHDHSAVTDPEPISIEVAPAPKPKPKRVVDKKTARQERAKLLKQRAAVVGPLEKRIEQIESEIMELEESSEALLEELNSASLSGDGDAIAKLSRQSAVAKQKVDGLFEEMEKLSAERDSAAAEFDERLAELE